MDKAVQHFKDYDFDGDVRWKEYLNNLTFPHGRDDLLIKYKARWFKREIDPDLDVDLVIPATPVTSKASAATPGLRSSSPLPSRPPTASTAPGSQGQQQQPGRRGAHSFLDLALLFGHVVLVISAVLAVQPFNPFLAKVAFSYFSRASLFVHGTRLIRKVGKPSFVALKPWLQQASTTTEGFYLLTTIILTSNPSAWAGILPMAILAVYHISAALYAMLSTSTLWKISGAAAAHEWLAARQQIALLVMAVMEIGTGITLLMGVLRQGPRALMVSYMYFGNLRVRYWSPESRSYHVMAWTRLGEMVAPVVNRVALLQKVSMAGKRWFQSGAPARA